MKGMAGCFMVARWGLVALSVMMLTGHVCVLPTDGHVDTAPRHVDEAHPPDADEAVHGASCEALPSSWVACPAAFTISSVVVASPVEQPKRQIGSSSISASPTASPPLFLLHAAFLI